VPWLVETRVWIRPSKHGRLSCCCYFIKQLFYGFRVWMAWSKHLGMLLELRKASKITRLWLVFRVLFLTLATFPRVWIRPSKHGNHKVIVYWNRNFLVCGIGVSDINLDTAGLWIVEKSGHLITDLKWKQVCKFQFSIKFQFSWTNPKCQVPGLAATAMGYLCLLSILQY
jgi:hypothetical protein